MPISLESRTSPERWPRSPIAGAGAPVNDYARSAIPHTSLRPLSLNLAPIAPWYNQRVSKIETREHAWTMSRQLERATTHRCLTIPPPLADVSAASVALRGRR